MPFDISVKNSSSLILRDFLLVMAHRHRVLQEKMKLEREWDQTATACGRRREQMQMFIMEK
jgi:hypothetical protein